MSCPVTNNNTSKHTNVSPFEFIDLDVGYGHTKLKSHNLQFTFEIKPTISHFKPLQKMYEAHYIFDKLSDNEFQVFKDIDRINYKKQGSIVGEDFVLAQVLRNKNVLVLSNAQDIQKREIVYLNF